MYGGGVISEHCHIVLSSCRPHTPGGEIHVLFEKYCLLFDQVLNIWETYAGGTGGLFDIFGQNTGIASGKLIPIFINGVER